MCVRLDPMAAAYAYRICAHVCLCVHCSQVAEAKKLIKPKQWLLLPTDWFEYLDNMAMPTYVTAMIVKKARADKPAFEVKMIGDGKPETIVTYYVEKHPYYNDPAHVEEKYAKMANRYLLNPAVKFLAGEPVTM